MDIKKVGVAGLGLMGHGFAQVAGQAGYEVVAREVDDEHVQKGIGKIEKQLGKAVEKGKMEQSDADAARSPVARRTSSSRAVGWGDIARESLINSSVTPAIAEMTATTLQPLFCVSMSLRATF